MRQIVIDCWWGRREPDVNGRSILDDRHKSESNVPNILERQLRPMVWKAITFPTPRHIGTQSDRSRMTDRGVQISEDRTQRAEQAMTSKQHCGRKAVQKSS